VKNSLEFSAPLDHEEIVDHFSVAKFGFCDDDDFYAIGMKWRERKRERERERERKREP
jgi:hypothetical protein